MRRRWAVLVGGLALAGLVIAGVVLSLDEVSSDRPSAPRVGGGLGSVPDVVLEDLRDSAGTVSLGELRGRPLVVNFFASWCAPCRREMPAFQAVHEDTAGVVRFLGIDNQDIRGDGLALVRETGVEFRLGFDPEGDAARAFGVLGMPTTVFVSADGEMLERVSGEMSETDLRETIRRLFGVDS